MEGGKPKVRPERAEAARSTRALRMPNPSGLIALLDQVVTHALERCVPLDPPVPVAALAAHVDATAPTADPAPLHATAARPMPGTVSPGTPQREGELRGRRGGGDEPPLPPQQRHPDCRWHRRR